MDHSDSGREGCTVTTLTVTAEPKNWQSAIKVAVQEVRTFFFFFNVLILLFHALILVLFAILYSPLFSLVVIIKHDHGLAAHADGQTWLAFGLAWIKI